jgi:hypothetical protein
MKGKFSEENDPSIVDEFIYEFSLLSLDKIELTVSPENIFLIENRINILRHFHHHHHHHHHQHHHHGDGNLFDRNCVFKKEFSFELKMEIECNFSCQ